MARNKPRKARGPSRPIDPRYAPGRPVQSNRDRFGMAMIAFGFVFVLIIILVASLAAGNTTTPATTTTNGTTSQTGNANTLATQQAIAIATQVIVDATQTAGLPRIEPAEAIALHAANNVKMFDVRQQNDYLTSHITGATNIPEADVANRMAEIPKTGNVIVYCQ